MPYNNCRPTEECPLTKTKSYKDTLSIYCGDGLKFIISCFAFLTISITSTLIVQIFYADGTPQDKIGIHGAVATDYTNCSQIGTKILRAGGNAVDAAVAATICMTVVAPHKTGLGGAGYMMIYNHKERKDPIIVDFASNTIGEKGVRIPAVLKGLKYVHTLKGKLSWNKVVQPAALLAEEGFVVSKELEIEVSKNIEYEALYGHISAGDILKLHDLSTILNDMALYGTEALYNETFLPKFLQDEQENATLLLELANYKPLVYVARRSSFYRHAIYYPPHMSQIEPIIKALEDLKISTANASTVATQIHVAKALINAISIALYLKTYGQREKYTGVMVMDWEDTYVCAITGLSTPFGLGRLSKGDFILDRTNNNTFSTLTPIIFHNERAVCGLRGVFGADDMLIIGQLLYGIIVQKLNVSEAIEYPRYYISSNGLVIENDQKHSVDVLIRNQLNLMAPASRGNIDFSKSVNAIIKRKDLMSSHSDSRGGGLASRF